MRASAKESPRARHGTHTAMRLARERSTYVHIPCLFPSRVRVCVCVYLPHTPEVCVRTLLSRWSAVCAPAARSFTLFYAAVATFKIARCATRKAQIYFLPPRRDSGRDSFAELYTTSLRYRAPRAMQTPAVSSGLSRGLG